jgi:molybdate transport system permease protein
VVLLGGRGALGGWLNDEFGYTILFRVEGAILAAGVVSFPLLYMPAKAAFRAIDRELHEMAALLGASRTQTFWYVSLPIAANGILSGVALCFARALGEFGATVMVFGWQPGRVTMPIAIYSAYEQGRMIHALPIVLALTLICFVLLVLINRVGSDRRA